MGRSNIMKLMIGMIVSTATLFSQAPSWAATETSDKGIVNYSQREVTATGIGAVPANAPNAGAARANAIRAAKIDALRNLIEAVKAVRVNSETTVQNNMVQNDIIRTSVEASVRGARMIGSAKYLSDSSVEVTMSVPMSGILDVLLPATAEGASETGEVNVAEGAVDNAGTVTQAGTGPITGLIIDARGLGLKPSMSPRILGQDGAVLYGPGTYSREFAVNQGVVGYHKDPAAAQADPRVAGNPVTLMGVGTGGNLATDVVITASASQQIAGMDGFGTALSNCRVMFILD